MSRPDLSRVPAWYHGYIKKVKENNLQEAFHNQTSSFIRFLRELPVEKRSYRYAEDKWTIQEVVQHIIDAERVFTYRALCIARGETNPLPSFDENSYAANSRAGKRNWEETIEEFRAVRQASEILFRSFDNEQLESSGIASGNSIYVLGIGFIVVGHVTHHLDMIRERYLEEAENRV